MPQPRSIPQSGYHDLSDIVNGPATFSCGQRFIIAPFSGRTIYGPLQALVLDILSRTVYTAATYTHPSLITTNLEWYGEITPIPAYPNPIIIIVETSRGRLDGKSHCSNDGLVETGHFGSVHLELTDVEESESDGAKPEFRESGVPLDLTSGHKMA